MPIAASIIAIVLLVLGALAFAVWLGLRIFLRRRLPQVRGRVTADGLAGQVTIRRDRLGVPHIEATTMADAAFAMGFVHAQDRLWQLEIGRRVAAGRISELAGAQGLPADRFLRRVGIMRAAEEEAAALSGDGLEMMTAYAAGVNSIIASKRRPLPVEFALLKARPAPWRPADSIAIAKLLNLGLALNWDMELERLDLLRAIGPERAAALELVYPDTNPTILAATLEATGGERGDALLLYREAARWIPSQGGGSNSWVVAGRYTATGRPLLCNDPHLPPGVPSVWYEAHVAAGGDFESTGVTTPGLPFPILGHNREVAWGYTNSFADVQDLVIEEFDDAAGHRYRTETGFATTGVVREVIRVKDRSDEVEEVLITRHGPIVDRLDDAGGAIHRGLALHWTMYEPGDTAGAMLAIQRATNWQEFKAAHRLIDGPSQNVVYADREGHIGYLVSGRIPVRKQAPSALPVPGWTGEAAWERYLAPEEMPQAFDPPEGVIITANNRVVGPGYPHYISNDYMNGYRALRIAELLARPDLTPADMRAFQLDVVCPPAREVVRLLLNTGDLEGQAEVVRRRLLAWDSAMTAEAEEPLLYEAFVRRLAEHALRPLCGDAWTILAGTDRSHPVFDYPGNIVGRLLPELLRRWRGGDVSLFAGTTLGWRQVAEDALRDAATDVLAVRPKRSARRWGDSHRLDLVHPIARDAARLGRLLNAGSFPIGGNSDCVLATVHNPAAPYRTTLWAPSWRTVMDPGMWGESTGVHLGGQSGQAGSRHHRDQVDSWRSNDQHTLLWDAAQVGEAARDTLVLVPPPPRAQASGEDDAAAGVNHG